MKFPRRIDAFGIGDLLACRGNTGFVSFNDGPNSVMPHIALVQTTVMSGMAAHRAKILAVPELQKWKDAGGIVILHGWALRPQNGVRGARKVWTLKEEVL